MPSVVWMRTIGVSCAANDWIASVRTTFGTRSTCRISIRSILAMAFPLCAQHVRDLGRRRHRRRRTHPLYADRCGGVGVSECVADVFSVSKLRGEGADQAI